MGYYTYYTLNVNKTDRVNGVLTIGDEPDHTNRIAKLEDDIDKIGIFGSGDIAFGYCSDPIKWYEHDEDMLKLSRLYPDLIFSLHGEGEGSGDLWYKYYFNGKMQYAPVQITYDDFSEDKLE